MQKKYEMTQYEAAKKKRLLVSSLILLFLVPLTIYAGIAFLGDRKYMFISILILLYTIIPFFMVFEKRKPKARELVMIAVMSALAACGTLACFMMIPFQAGTALVIVAGIALGPEEGFLVGALARFVCNFLWGTGHGLPGRWCAGGCWGFWPDLFLIKLI